MSQKRIEDSVEGNEEGEVASSEGGASPYVHLGDTYLLNTPSPSPLRRLGEPVAAISYGEQLASTQESTLDITSDNGRGGSSAEGFAEIVCSGSAVSSSIVALAAGAEGLLSSQSLVGLSGGASAHDAAAKNEYNSPHKVKIEDTAEPPKRLQVEGKAKQKLKPKPVVYIQDDDLCEYDFSLLIQQHAMKPYRFLATHELVAALGLHDYMRVIRKIPVLRPENLLSFHDPYYISNVVQHSERAWEWHPDTSLVGFTGDCPPMEGLMEYSCGIVAASLAGAALLNAGETDIAINWQGGMHHAKCGECSGFCYFNDIVIAILELLKAPQHKRVLYIDLDVHHGDGVEEAFIATNKVFTLSLHKFGENFFPGTGHPLDVGFSKGKYCTLNVPVWDNITDIHYTTLFKRALDGVVNHFAPDAIVLQCGADSLSGDRFGTLNLSSVGHSACVGMVAALGLPLLVVGGGGYTVKNVARLWATETAILCGAPLPPNTPLPFDDLPQTGWLYEGSNGTLLVPSNSCGYATTPNTTAGSSASSNAPMPSVSVATASVTQPQALGGYYNNMGGSASNNPTVTPNALPIASKSGVANTLNNVTSPMDPPEASATNPQSTSSSARNTATVGPTAAAAAPSGNNSAAMAALTSHYAFLTARSANSLTYNDQLQVLLQFIDERVAAIPYPR